MPNFLNDPDVPRPKLIDSCGNCQENWPCECPDPHRVCGVCGDSLHTDCMCDDREYSDVINTAEELAEALKEQHDATKNAGRQLVGIGRQLGRADGWNEGFKYAIGFAVEVLDEIRNEEDHEQTSAFWKGYYNAVDKAKERIKDITR